VIADRTSRQKVIVLSEIVAMTAQLSVAILFITGCATVWNLAFCMLFNGFALAFNAPASLGFITQLVDKEDLQSTNALLGIARNASMIGGAALGGILVALVGAGYTLLIDALSFGFSAFLVWTLKPKQQVTVEKTSLIADLKLGWHAFSTHTWVWVIVLQFAFVVAAFQSVIALIGPAVANIYYNGAQDWGFIVGGFGVGLVLGGLIGFRLRAKYPLRIATLSILIYCLVPFSLSVPVPVLWVAFAAMLAGMGGQIFGIIWISMLQLHIPPHLLSRVSAYDHIGSISLTPLGIIAAGYLFEMFGYQFVLVFAGLMIAIPTIITLCVKDVWSTSSSSSVSKSLSV